MLMMMTLKHQTLRVHVSSTEQSWCNATDPVSVSTRALASRSSSPLLRDELLQLKHCVKTQGTGRIRLKCITDVP